MNPRGQQLNEIHIPYAPEITGLGFSRYNLGKKLFLNKFLID